MTTDRLQRNAFLESRSDPFLPLRHSPSARRRGVQLQGFLRDLEAASRDRYGVRGGAELLVVDAVDWRRSFSYPYGLPFTRTRSGSVSIVVAAAYPDRLLHRFDDVLVRAARAGAEPPGPLREFLDLLSGHEWGHALANRAGVRTRVRWLDELVATLLFLAALRDAGFDGLLERFIAWARVQVHGSGVDRIDLGSFEYPRGKGRFDVMLYGQGRFTLRALELLEAHGHAFTLGLQGALAERSGRAGRGDVARLVLELDGSFREWFATFGTQAADDDAEPADRTP